MASVLVATVDDALSVEVGEESVVVVEAVAVGTIEGAAAGSTMTVRVLVEVRPDWSVVT